MIAEIGLYGLALALFAAVVLAVLARTGAARVPHYRALQYALPVLAFAALLAFFIHRLQQAHEDVTANLKPLTLIGEPAPSFDLPPLAAGRPGFKSADLKGKVTLVDFFASWCVPCRAEHPVLSLAAKAGIRLVGIDYKDGPAGAEAFLADLGDPYAVVAVDAHGQTATDFGVYGVPESYLIDKQGVIRFKQFGPLTPKIMQEQLLPLAQKLRQER